MVVFDQNVTCSHATLNLQANAAVIAAKPTGLRSSLHLEATAVVVSAEAALLGRGLHLEATAVVVSAKAARLNSRANLQARFRRRLHRVVSFLSALRARPGELQRACHWRGRRRGWISADPRSAKYD